MPIKNALIVGAHYDDAELGAGGTAAKLADDGVNVYKLTLTDNDVESSVFNQRTQHQKSHEESKKACEILKITQIENFPQSKVCQLVYNTDLMRHIEAVILKHEIDTVFMHWEFDVNQDHVECGKLCKTAARHCENIFVYQSNLYILSQPYYPTVFFDISSYIEKKRYALDQYGSEHQRYSSLEDNTNTLFENVILRNQSWGFSNGVHYAEGFIPYKLLF